MKNVAAFTGGRRVPSARLRVRQLVPTLLNHGFAVHENWSRLGAYPPEQQWLRPLWAAATLAERVPHVLTSHRYDAVFLQRELLSTFVTLEPFTKAPRVLDVDDAIFLHREGKAARRLAEISEHVICGNHFLADWFSKFHHRVSIVPTAIETGHYFPKPSPQDSRTIVWIGSSPNLHYLLSIERALKAVLDRLPDARLRVICDKVPTFPLLRPEQIEFVQWSEENEVTQIQSATVGIMPLECSDWARGKCSYKMLQYMACELPVVVSPVGMNAEILALANVGMAARTESDWTDGICQLLSDRALANRLGSAGRQVVERSFSVTEVAKSVARILGSL